MPSPRPRAAVGQEALQPIRHPVERLAQTFWVQHWHPRGDSPHCALSALTASHQQEHDNAKAPDQGDAETGGHGIDGREAVCRD